MKATRAVTSCWREIFAKCGHVAAALNHLPDQLVAGQTRGHTIQCWAAQAAFAAQAVAIPALLVLHHQRALQLQRRTSLHILHRRGNAGPGFHVGTPRSVCPQVSQGADGRNTRITPNTAMGRRRALFSPVLEIKGSAKRSPMPTTGAVSSRKVSKYGGSNASAA